MDGGKDVLFLMFMIALLIGGLLMVQSLSFPVPTEVITDTGTEDDGSYEQGTITKVAPGEEVGEEDENISPFADAVTLSSGSAQSADDPYREYVTIRLASSYEAPVVISGWRLKNNKDERYYQFGNSVRRGVADVVTIPGGTNLLTNYGRSSVGPITLNPGDRAHIITGTPPLKYPALIDASFRTNICTGYLAEGADFYPSLARDCPTPSDEVDRLIAEDECYDYVDRLPSCRDPFFDPEPDSIPRLSNQCRSFIQNTLNYHGCVRKHRFDEDFFGGTWYVYMKRGRELWSNRRETVMLYDTEGRIVDEIMWD